MKGYRVVTSDEHKVGRVVDVRDEHLIVEHGTVRKSRHALPKAFAHPIDAEEVVRVTVGKQLIADSPKLDGDVFDEGAVARYYGLASGSEHPDTEGRGETLPQDPAEGSEVEGERHGIDPAEKTRAEIREGKHDAAAPAVRERMANANDPAGTTANHH
jgi:hypothetical protein